MKRTTAGTTSIWPTGRWWCPATRPCARWFRAIRFRWSTAREAGYPDRLISFQAGVGGSTDSASPTVPGRGTVIRTGYGIYSVPYATHAAQAAGFPVGGFGIDRAGLLAARVRGALPVGGGVRPQPDRGRSAGSHHPERVPATDGHPWGDSWSTAWIPICARNNWPYDQQWNLTIEQELGHGFAMRTSYVGTKGTNWRSFETPATGAQRHSFAERTDKDPLRPRIQHGGPAGPGRQLQPPRVRVRSDPSILERTLPERLDRPGSTRSTTSRAACSAPQWGSLSRIPTIEPMRRATRTGSLPYEAPDRGPSIRSPSAGTRSMAPT